ncbi:unnamed protein product [Phaedon cochleariae]|uniref:Spondin-like TSP1 domain-containing protein n=1 Tax=Phaedon cochleariae TaxID=80249 RepID=A0A9N9SHG0_PHACE|nr:unnamed protein product [Phaedon cochleariae]
MQAKSYSLGSCDVSYQIGYLRKLDEPQCTDRKWGPWGPCNVSCGTGYKTRVSLPKEDQNDEDNENDAEENCPGQETVKCSMPCNEEPFGENLVILEQLSDGRVLDCKVSQWTVWSPCDLNGASCGHGYIRRNRYILRHPENGGRSCPHRLSQKRTCWIPCRREAPNDKNPDFDINSSMEERDDGSLCEMSEWTAWSPCSSICGSNAKQQRTRKILNKPSGLSPLDCPTRLDLKPCNLPIACTDDGKPILF